MLKEIEDKGATEIEVLPSREIIGLKEIRYVTWIKPLPTGIYSKQRTS